MGEFLQELFKQHHLNQASVARALGQSSQNISDMLVSEGPLPAYGQQATHLVSKPSSFKLIIELEHYPAESRIELLSFLERLSARRPGTQLGHDEPK